MSFISLYLIPTSRTLSCFWPVVGCTRLKLTKSQINEPKSLRDEFDESTAYELVNQPISKHRNQGRTHV